MKGHVSGNLIVCDKQTIDPKNIILDRSQTDVCHIF